MIKAAAIRLGSMIFTLPIPKRHHDIIALMHELQIPKYGRQQGFITKEAKFVDRIEGARIALENGQVKNNKLIAPPNLYSEDIW